MILSLDFESEVPIYLQIKNEIIRGIATGALKENDELPSVRSLAADLDINMHTVNKAYSLLRDENFVKMDRRKGALISFDFKNQNENFKLSLDSSLETCVIECIARDIPKEILLEKITSLFNKQFN